MKKNCHPTLLILIAGMLYTNVPCVSHGQENKSEISAAASSAAAGDSNPTDAAHEARFAAMSPSEMRAFEIEVVELLRSQTPRSLQDKDLQDKEKRMTRDDLLKLQSQIPRSLQDKEKIADLALIPPQLNTSPLPRYDYDKLDYGMNIGIARAPGGRLWACWVAGEDGPRSFFVLATSDDDGETWSKPRLVIDAQSPDLLMQRSVLVGNLWTDPKGTLWLFFSQSMMMFDGRAGVWVATCKNPDAATPEWSAPRRLWHGYTLNKPVVLSTGKWLLPISLLRGGWGGFEGAFKNLDPLRGANAFVSTDQGATWQRHGHVAFPNPDWDEHMFIERRDGSLWMLARTTKGIMQSTSSNGGETWTVPSEPPGIRQPPARFHIRRLASGRLLLVKHGDTADTHEGKRNKLKAFLSEDDGLTWNGGLMLDERDGVSYPDGFQAPDGTLYISYDRNRKTDGEILLARFTETDVLKGRLNSPRSKLQMLISHPVKKPQTLK